MAGKTFPGIGDLEDEPPPLDPADAADGGSSASYYSGPTVVDDAKVEQGLKKLRSLDAPPGPHTGVHRVPEAGADPGRVPPKPAAEAVPLIPEITVDSSRGTAVGRSVSGPLAGQQTTAPLDDKHLRGTMFGHGVHLPDFEPARRSEEVETSKALAVVERGKPTNQDIAVFQPGPYAHYRATPAAEAPYQHQRTNRLHRTPIEVQPLPPRRKIVTRILAAAACIGLIVVAALLWVRANTEDPNAYPRPAAGVPAARPIDLHPLAPPPPPPPEVVPPPEAFAPRPPGGLEAQPLPAKPAPGKPARSATPDDETAAGAPRVGKPPVAMPAPARHPHPSRRHAAVGEALPDGTSKPDQGKPEGAEPKPAKGKRPAEEDPDATMAPTIE